MKLRKMYRFRMRPTTAQEQQLRFQAGARRFVWNWALARKRDYYKEHGKGVPTNVLKAELPKLKAEPETAWMKSADSQSLQETLRDLDRAFVNFFQKRAGFPRFKSRKRDAARFRISQRVVVANGAVSVPKIGSVRIHQSQSIDGDTKSATFKQDASGNWDVSLVSEFSMPDTPLIPVDATAVAGVDLGLKDFAVVSDGRRVSAPKFFRSREHKLRRAQRTLSRRQARSNRRAKAKRAVARIHARTANLRKDFVHKFTTELVRKHEGICIEDLNTKGLAKTKLAKSILDAAFGEVRRQLEYKTVWNRRHLAVIDRWYPSSKTCHACGAVNTDLMLADRQWMCVCGVCHDRDFNAALNIRSEGLKLIPLAAGYAESINARGPDVRLPLVEAIGVEARIPCL
jgi:putative transposase